MRAARRTASAGLGHDPDRQHHRAQALELQPPLEGVRRLVVEDALEPALALEDELPGVERISASYKKQVMEVDFDETKLSVEEIIAAANAIGYHPELVQA